MEMTIKMKNKFNLGVIATLTLLTLMISGCSFSVGTTPDSAKANTNTASTNKPATNTGTSNTGTAPKKDEKPQAKLENEKKPEGQKSTKAKEVKVPDDWVYVYDEAKGYGFSLPAGSNGGSETADGVDVFLAKTPEPSEIGVMVLAFKDAKLSKEDLLDRAGEVLKALGATIQSGKLTNESEDYAVAEATMTGQGGGKAKAKILVGTDVTDNYVMIVSTEETKYAANEKIIDGIWGSFEMWSGGASGEN
jgi:hypothetical protein